jgi:hypothetical protein
MRLAQILAALVVVSVGSLMIAIVCGCSSGLRLRATTLNR